MICPISQGCASTDDGLLFIVVATSHLLLPTPIHVTRRGPVVSVKNCRALVWMVTIRHQVILGFRTTCSTVRGTPFFTRTRRGSGAVTMQPEDGRIASGSQTAETKYFTCVREIGAVCGDGHVQTGEECDDGNDTDDDVCDNTCKRTM